MYFSLLIKPQYHFYFLGVVIFFGLEKDLSFTFLVLLVAISI